MGIVQSPLRLERARLDLAVRCKVNIDILLFMVISLCMYRFGLAREHPESLISARITRIQQSQGD